MTLPKIFNNPIVIGLLIYAVIITISFFVCSFGGDDTSRVNLEELYSMFEGVNELENNMRFDIDIEGCHIKGEYKGDHFRETVASGEHELCNRFNVKLGKDPDEYTDTIVRKEILDRINRLQNKKECKKMISKRACSKVPKCKWEEREEECPDTFGECSKKDKEGYEVTNKKDCEALDKGIWTIKHPCCKLRSN